MSQRADMWKTHLQKKESQVERYRKAGSYGLFVLQGGGWEGSTFSIKYFYLLSETGSQSMKCE